MFKKNYQFFFIRFFASLNFDSIVKFNLFYLFLFRLYLPIRISRVANSTVEYSAFKYG